MFHHHDKTKILQGAAHCVWRIEKPQQLLTQPARLAPIQQIMHHAAFDKAQYNTLVAPLINAIAYYCQHLPESKNHHYIRQGGLLDYTLYRTEAALALFRDYCITSPEERDSKEQQSWLYALLSGSLLQGIGKLVTEYQITLINNQQQIRQWVPLLAPQQTTDIYYQYDWTGNNDSFARRGATVMLAQQLMPTAGLKLIVENTAILTQWLALLLEDESMAGTFGAVLERAKLIAIMHDIQDILGQNETQDPNLAIFSDNKIEIDKQKKLGLEFIEWVQNGLSNGELLINQYPYFMLIPDGVLMSQELFKRFAEKHPKYKKASIVQDAFLALNLHKADDNGALIARFEHAQKHKVISGLVVSAAILPKYVHFYDAKSKSVTQVAAIELMHHADHKPYNKPLSHLSRLGTWVTPENVTSFIKPGIKPRG